MTDADWARLRVRHLLRKRWIKPVLDRYCVASDRWHDLDPLGVLRERKRIVRKWKARLRRAEAMARRKKADHV